MKILYGIQGTGNGHVSRAREIIPELKKYGEVDVVLSGTHSEVDPGHEVKFSLHGLGFKFGKNGKIDFLETLRDFQFSKFIKEIKQIPVENYDLVIQDVEPVIAWACRMKNISCIEMSHQISLSSPLTPKIKGLHYGRFILDHYTPNTKKIGFHFKKYDEFIHTPVIRSEIRALQSFSGDFYVVYLPAYGDEFLQNLLQPFRHEQFVVFSKHAKKAYTIGNIKFKCISNHAYIENLKHCKGLITGAGFEGPSEALFLQKKLICVPMTNQYEQLCNAKALEEIGVPIVWHKKEFSNKLKQFFNSKESIKMNFPDETEAIIRNLIQNM